MTEKGFCQRHNYEFVLTEGCPRCLAEKREKPGFSAFSGSEITSQEKADEIASAMLDEHADSSQEIMTLVPKQGGDTKVANYYSQALKLREYAESRVVKTIEDIKIATDDLTIIARLKKAIAEKKKEFLKPHQETIRAINDNYNFWMEPVETADKITRDKILAFNSEREERRRKEEEINRKRMEAAQEEMELTGELSESVNLIEVTPEVKRISTEMGTTGMATIWKFDVLDFALVPDEYKIIDASKVGKVVRAGLRTIPGIRIYSEQSLRVTTK